MQIKPQSDYGFHRAKFTYQAIRGMSCSELLTARKVLIHGGLIIETESLCCRGHKPLIDEALEEVKG